MNLRVIESEKIDLAGIRKLKTRQSNVTLESEDGSDCVRMSGTIQSYSEGKSLRLLMTAKYSHGLIQALGSFLQHDDNKKVLDIISTRDSVLAAYLRRVAVMNGESDESTLYRFSSFTGSDNKLVPGKRTISALSEPHKEVVISKLKEQLAARTATETEN